jgi:hypothetical protein
MKGTKVYCLFTEGADFYSRLELYALCCALPCIQNSAHC